MASKRSHQDPDYEDVSHHEAKRQKVIQKDAKEATKRKIEDIIKMQFSTEIMNKEKEIIGIDQKLNEARTTMDKLRACIVATYFASAGQQKLSKTKSSSLQPPVIHPEVKKYIEPSNTKTVQSTSTIEAPLNGTEDASSSQSLEPVKESKCKSVEEHVSNKMKLNEARTTMDKLRACIVATYFASAGQQKLSKTKSSSLQPPVIHPEVKKYIEPSNTKTVQSTSTIEAPLNGTEDASSSQSLEPVKESKCKSVEEHVSNKMTSLSSTASSGDNVEGCSRFKMKKKIIVGNVSRYIPNENREENDQSTHKWMVYVRGAREEPRIDHFIQKVWFFLHPSYRPNDLVEICEPPFHLTRRGWGEFPVRIQLHFTDARNKRVDVIHRLKLDKTYTGLQTLGAETVVEVEIEKDTALEKCNVINNPSDTTDSQCVTSITKNVDCSPSSNKVEKHDSPPQDSEQEKLYNSPAAKHIAPDVTPVNKSVTDDSKTSSENVGTFMSCESGSLIQKFTSIKQEPPISSMVIANPQSKGVTGSDSLLILPSVSSVVHNSTKPASTSQQCSLITASQAMNTAAGKSAGTSLVLVNSVKTSLSNTTIPTSSIPITNSATSSTRGSAACSTTNTNSLITCVDAQGKLYLVPQHVLPQLKTCTSQNPPQRINITFPAASSSATSLLKPMSHSINGQVAATSALQRTVSKSSVSVISSPHSSGTSKSNNPVSVLANSKNAKADVLTTIPFPGNGITYTKPNIVTKLSLLGAANPQQMKTVPQSPQVMTSKQIASSGSVTLKVPGMNTAIMSSSIDGKLIKASPAGSNNDNSNQIHRQNTVSLLSECSIKENKPVAQTIKQPFQMSVNANALNMKSSAAANPGNIVSIGNQKYAVKMLQESKNNTASTNQILLVPCLSSSSSFNQVTSSTFKPNNVSANLPSKRKLTVAEQLKIKYSVQNKNRSANRVINSLKEDLTVTLKNESKTVKQIHRVNVFREYLSLCNYSATGSEDSKQEKVPKDVEGKEKKIIVCKKQCPFSSGQTTSVIEPIRLEDFPDMKSLVKAAVKQHPIINQQAEKHIFPYCARTQTEWLSWNVGKRRASEWQRAADVRRFIHNHLINTDSVCGDKLWSTRQIMTWCRLHAYSPHFAEKRQDEERDTVNILPLHPSEINSHTNIEDISSRLELVLNSLDTDGDSDSDVDIVSVDAPKIKIKAEIKEEPDRLPEAPSLTVESVFIHDTTRKIGVRFNPAQEENITMCVTGDMVFVAMLNFMEEILTDSFASATKERGYPSEIVSEDIYRAINSNKTTDFLTNKHLGVSENKLKHSR